MTCGSLGPHDHTGEARTHGLAAGRVNGVCTRPGERRGRSKGNRSFLGRVSRTRRVLDRPRQLGDVGSRAAGRVLAEDLAPVLVGQLRDLEDTLPTRSRTSSGIWNVMKASSERAAG